MAMGIVSDKEFDTEASKIVDKSQSQPSSTPKAVIVDVNRGRGNNPEVPNALRNVIGETAVTDGRQQALELAASFGISGSSVSAYTNGATSTGSYDDTPNAPIIGKAKQRIAKRARNRLMGALRHITEDKLSSANAKDLSSIAKDMSAVVRSMEEDNNPLNKEKSGPTFVFYSPQVRNEKVFDVVHAKE